MEKAEIIRRLEQNELRTRQLEVDLGKLEDALVSCTQTLVKIVESSKELTDLATRPPNISLSPEEVRARQIQAAN